MHFGNVALPRAWTMGRAKVFVCVLCVCVCVCVIGTCMTTEEICEQTI